jgi:DNA-binding transcriptional ArsR family regulator
MRDVLLIDSLPQADALMRPGRADILRRLVAPRSCGQVARDLGSTPQQVYYHVKALETARLAEKVSETRARGFNQAFYQAAASSYWLSPRLVHLAGGDRAARDQTSRSFLLDLAEELHIEVGQLAGRDTETPMLGLSAHVALADPARRAAFMADLQEAVQALATKYGGPASEESYRLVLACYPAAQPPTGDQQ